MSQYVRPIDGSGVGGSIATKDDGSIVNASTIVLNFTGDGVVATDAGGGQTNIQIDGGSIATKDEGSLVNASTSALNFTGGGVVATDAGGGQTNIQIDGVPGGFAAQLKTEGDSAETLATITPADNTTVLITAEVVARVTSGSQSAGFVLTAAFRRSGGTTTQIAPTDAMAFSDGGPLDASLIPSGANILISVIGAPEASTDWFVRGRQTVASLIV